MLYRENMAQLKPLKTLGRGEVKAMTWLDDETLAVASTFALWHYGNSQREVYRFHDEQISVASVFRFTHQRLLLWDGQRTIFIYDPRTGSRRSVIKLQEPAIDYTFQFELSADNTRLMTLCKGTIRVYDATTGRLQLEIDAAGAGAINFHGEKPAIKPFSGSFSMYRQIHRRHPVVEGQYRQAVVEERRIQLMYDGQTQMLEGHQADICAVQFAPDERMLVSVDESETMILWDVRTYEPITRQDGFGTQLLTVSGDAVAAVNRANEVTVWNGALQTFKHGHSSAATRLHFYGDGLISVSQRDHKVCWWKDDDLQHMVTVKGGQFPVFILDGARFATTDGDEYKEGTMRVYHDGEQIFSREGAFPLAFHGQSILFATGKPQFFMRSTSWYEQVRLTPVDDTVHLFSADLETGEEQHLLFLNAEDYLHISNRFYLRNAGIQALSVFDFESQRLLYTVYPAYERLRYTQFSDDGRYFLTISRENPHYAVEVWELETGKQVTRGELPDGSIALFSPDSRLVAIEGSREVFLWNAHTHQLQGQFPIEKLSRLVFSPDSSMLAAFYQTHGDIELWDTQTVTRITTLKTGQNEVDSVAFSPEWLVVGNGNGTIEFWGI